MKSIPHLYRECKHLLSRVPNEVLVLILCLLVLTVGYVLGYKSAQEVMGKGVSGCQY
jgi:hypothetical protein